MGCLAEEDVVACGLERWRCPIAEGEPGTSDGQETAYAPRAQTSSSYVFIPKWRGYGGAGTRRCKASSNRAVPERGKLSQPRRSRRTRTSVATIIHAGVGVQRANGGSVVRFASPTSACYVTRPAVQPHEIKPK